MIVGLVANPGAQGVDVRGGLAGVLEIELVGIVLGLVVGERVAVGVARE